MKTLPESLLAFALVLAVSCNKDKLEPTESNTNFEVEASVTIGPEGGSVETESFILTIPAGAFDSETDLVLSSAVDKETFGECLVSKMYKIDGIPVEYNKSLKVKIKYEGTLSEESYIALGEEVFVSSLDSVTNAYQFMNAVDSSGWLVGEIPAPEVHPNTSGSKRKSTKETDFTGYILGSVTNYLALYSESNHFFITYPMFLVNSTDVSELGKYLEEAYSFFQNELSFDYGNRTNWPVRVVVCPFPLSYTAVGFYTNSCLGNNGGWIEFNYAALQNRQDIRTTAGHEFFHLVQSLYDSRNRFSKAKFAADHHWFNEATAVWSESFFSDEADFQSDIVDGNQMAPFNGLHAGSLLSKDSLDHGYGLLSLINYLDGIYGTEFILKTYQSIYAEQMHIIDAISKHTSEPVSWLEDFFRQYVLNNLNVLGTNISYFNSQVHGTLSITNKDNVDTSLRSNYPDLSARLFSITFDEKNIDDNDNMIITTEGLTEITVIKWITGQDSKVEFVANSTGKLTIGNLKSDYIDKKARMFVLITNYKSVPPYTGKTLYDVNFNITREMTAPDYNRCKFYVIVKGHYHTITDTVSKEYDLNQPHVSEFYPGTFTGNTFSGSYYNSRLVTDHQNEDRKFDEITIGEMTVILNQHRDSVENITWSEETNSDYLHTTISFAGKNIPLKSGSTNTYEIISESVCEKNISFLNYHFWDQYFDSEYTNDLQYISCTNESIIFIRFLKE